MYKLLVPIVLLLTLVARAEDQIISIDAASSLLTVQQKGTLKSFRLKPYTDITINGQKGTPDQLKAGMQVTLSLADAQTASKVAARGNIGAAPVAPGGVPPGVPAQPPGSLAPFMSERGNAQLIRKIVIKASIDGDDKFSIEGGVIKIQHGGWKKPADISVNGIGWKVNWTGNASDDFTALQPTLAPFPGAHVTVKKVKGRGDATVIEPPTETNGQRLVVHLKDEGTGASDFEVRITW